MVMAAQIDAMEISDSLFVSGGSGVAGPEGGGGGRIALRDGDAFAEFVGEGSVDANAEGHAVGSVGAVKLVHGIEPGAIGLHVALFTGLRVEQIERLVQVGAEPQELVAAAG